MEYNTQDAEKTRPAPEAPIIAGWAAFVKEARHLLCGVSQPCLYLCRVERVILEEAHCKQGGGIAGKSEKKA